MSLPTSRSGPFLVAFLHSDSSRPASGKNSLACTMTATIPVSLPLGVNFSLRHERIAVGADAMANPIGAGDPARTLHDQEQLVEARRVWADRTTRRKVKGVDM